MFSGTRGALGGAVLLISTLLVLPAQAQTGAVRGTVLDAETGETIIGANVRLEGTTTGSTTDLDGRYEILNVPQGIYRVVFSYIGYAASTVTDVEVMAGQATRLDVTLRPAALGLDEVTVEARAIRNNEATLLRDRQKATAVSDAISAEAISRSGAGDAAAAMSRVTGASVVGGRYVYVRGLGDRYSTTQLNGADLPSADPDRRAFNLDLFPSNLLDNIVTLKTFTPDKPGSFTGGLVNVGTRSFPEAFTFQFSTRVGYNSRVSLQENLLGYAGGRRDWMGFDDGSRGLSSLIPETTFKAPSSVAARRSDSLATLIDQTARAFSPVMTPTLQEAPVNRSFSVSVGNQVRFLGRPLGFTGSFSYGQDYSGYTDGVSGRWNLSGGQVGEGAVLVPRNLYGDSLGVNQHGSADVNWGGIGTLSYKPHPNHSVTGTYLRTQSGSSSARYVSGYWEELTGNVTFESRMLSYTERSLHSYQLRGESVLPGMTVEWNASYATNTQAEPDVRFFANAFSEQEVDGQARRTYYIPYSNVAAPLRYFRALDETTTNLSLDVTVPFRTWGGLASRFKFGALQAATDRTFRERRFDYQRNIQVNFADFNGDVNAYFRAAGIVDTLPNGTYVIGNYLNEATEARNNYDAAQRTPAAYGMVDLLLNRRLRFIGGVRFERTRIEAVSLDPDEPRGAIRTDDWLPSLNLVYEVAPNMNVRGAATRTVARPVFRELSPYTTFQTLGDETFEGNPDLERTLVSNFDLRWDWFARPGEIVAVSLFAKQFQNPIERVILIERGNRATSIQNVDAGRVVGAEFEVRTRLDWIAPLLQHVRAGGNLTLVRSEVDIPAAERESLRQADPGASAKRELVGQSPYVLNLDVGYERPASGTAVNVFYNVFGPRLSTVVSGGTPDIYERPRPVLDLVVAQQLGRGVSTSLRVRNLFDTATRFAQQFQGQAYLYERYHSGREVSLGFTYAL